MGILVHDHQHSSADIIDFSSVPPSPIASRQTVSLLGPYLVNYNDPGLENTDSITSAVTLETVPENGIIFAAWAFFEEGWAGPTSAQLSILLKPKSNEFDSVVSYNAGENDVFWDEANFRFESNRASNPQNGQIGQALDDSVEFCVATLVSGGGPTTAGIARVFALVATPQ